MIHFSRFLHWDFMFVVPQSLTKLGHQAIVKSVSNQNFALICQSLKSRQQRITTTASCIHNMYSSMLSPSLWQISYKDLIMISPSCTSPKALSIHCSNWVTVRYSHLRVSIPIFWGNPSIDVRLHALLGVLPQGHSEH